MSGASRHHPSGDGEQKSSQDDGTGGAPTPPPPPQHQHQQQNQTSSIPLPTTLSNAQDLRPGAWPEGHPMSRVRSDGEVKEITWLTAKVRRQKEEDVSLFFRSKRTTRTHEEKKKIP